MTENKRRELAAAVGAAIARIRGARSKSAFARELGCFPSLVTRWETGASLPTGLYVGRLLNAAELPLEKLDLLRAFGADTSAL